MPSSSGPNSPLRLFIWKTLLWLPLSFGGWYYLAIGITRPLVYVTDLVMVGLFPMSFSAVEQSGFMLNVVTHYAPTNPPNPLFNEGVAAELVFSINPLVYGYSFPLYTALVLAAPGAEGEKWARWIGGILILFPAQVWGVCLETLKTLVFDLDTQIAQRLDFPGWQLEGIALGYQFGYLVLPAVTPIVAWIALHRDYLAKLSPELYQRLAHSHSTGTDGK